MQVLINDCPVDFNLEQEKNVSDIIDSVSTWTRERDLIFYELYIDKDRYAIDTAPDISLADVKTINCIVQSRADIVFSTVDEAARYCDRASLFIKQVLETGELKRGDIEDLQTGITWLLEVLSTVTGLMGVDRGTLKYRDRDISHHVNAIENFRDALVADGDMAEMRNIIGAHAGLFSDIKYMFRMLLMSDAMRSLIVQSVDSPDVIISSLKQTREELAGELANIQAAAVAYQIGKDSEGSERLKRFVDFIYRYTRSCYQIGPVFKIDLAGVIFGGMSLEKKNHDMRNLLHEVITVMENNDIISLSDILEYEILPSLENLGSYIDMLLSNISCK
ncbi:MAG: hypothetical protein A2176_06420 [Spirochaetes bacterium RBG_13_51_14]|nr:MAG: hypothetical protein A2176_06420 [Spirochaetes bacterium RBG_13_51_14]